VSVELIAPTLTVAGICILIAYLPLLVWRLLMNRRSGPSLGEYSTMAATFTLGLGVVGFFLGFIGPIVLNSGQAQGPMLGIFITGPLGALIGLFVTWVWFYVRRRTT
jgi:hypothetical protein